MENACRAYSNVRCPQNKRAAGVATTQEELAHHVLVGNTKKLVNLPVPLAVHAPLDPKESFVVPPMRDNAQYAVLECTKMYPMLLLASCALAAAPVWN
jgi:hypothetical protein